jgi:protein-tyrosine kinase
MSVPGDDDSERAAPPNDPVGQGQDGQEGQDGQGGDRDDQATDRAKNGRPAASKSRALLSRRRLTAPEPEEPADGEAPIGMATAEQLDAFRELRTRLLTMATNVGLTHFTTLVVPASRGAGASFVARNLATAFTLQERRVAILVDCNLRSPTQHLALRAGPGDEGLFDYLDRPHAAMERLVRPTDIPGLHLIPAGRPSPVPREYFSSQAMRLLMTGLHQAPCYVFLDSPPAKGSPDARILSDLADFVILVVGYGQEVTDEIARAAALFDPTKFGGVVFNERF